MAKHSPHFVPDTDDTMATAQTVILDWHGFARSNHLSFRDEPEWTRAAQFHVDTGGDDDGGFQGLLDGLDAGLNPTNVWVIDADFLRDERAEQRGAWA